MYGIRVRCGRGNAYGSILVLLACMAGWLGASGIGSCAPAEAPAAEKVVAEKVAEKPAPHDWALATNGPLAMARDCKRIDLLGWDERTSATVATWTVYMRDFWGVESRDGLLKSIDWLKSGGHRVGFKKEGERLAAMTPEQLKALEDGASNDQKFRNTVLLANYPAQGERGILAWDYIRIIQNAGWGYLAGYLTEKDAWDIMMPIARDLQKNFKSWDDLEQNYMIGREYWSHSETSTLGPKLAAAHKQLMEDPKSPYHTIPWDLDLGGK